MNNRKGEIIILPGKPDDDNTDYLPLSLKNTDIVVNENGNNSKPYPNLIEKHEDIIGDGLVNEWFEYVPDSYDPSRKVPLVFSMHGGLMSGWGQAVYTSWTEISDREGFICVFPTASEHNAWKVEMTEEGRKNIEALAEIHPEFNFGKPLPPERVIDDNRDVKFIMALLEKLKHEYNIDESRVYMQGMSMGNAMTALFARNHAHILAAAAGSGGPSDIEIIYNPDGTVKNRSGALFVWQTRPELNGMPNDVGMSEFDYNRLNREYWLKINDCSDAPEIRIIGEDNFVFYTGSKADLVYLDIKNRDHGQAFDEAELTWDYLFSSVRRNPDGSFERLQGVNSRKGDDFAIAFSPNSKHFFFRNSVMSLPVKSYTWTKSKYHGQYGNHILRGEYICVPLSVLADIFEAEYLPSEGGRAVRLILKDGRQVQFAEGCIGCCIDNRIESMLCEAIFRDGELLVPAKWFCQSLFSLHASECNGVLYVTDHYSILSSDTSLIIKKLLD